MGRNDSLQVVRDAITTLQGKLAESWKAGDFSVGNTYIENLKTLRRFEDELTRKNKWCRKDMGC